MNHGHAIRGKVTKTYKCWQGMNQRCHNPKNTKYKNYGGRGITVCEEWRNSFDNFLSDMGEKPDGFLLDRENNDLGYYKNNCRWVTPKVSSSNTRRTRLLTFNGVTATITDWALKIGIHKASLRLRLKANWPIEKALSEGPSIIHRRNALGA